MKENWSKQLEHNYLSPTNGTETGVRRDKCSLLACQKRHKCSMGTSRNTIKIKVGIKGTKLMQIEKGRDLTQSYDKSPYTNRNVIRAK